MQATAFRAGSVVVAPPTLLPPSWGSAMEGSDSLDDRIQQALQLSIQGEQLVILSFRIKLRLSSITGCTKATPGRKYRVRPHSQLPLGHETSTLPRAVFGMHAADRSHPAPGSSRKISTTSPIIQTSQTDNTPAEWCLQETWECLSMYCGILAFPELVCCDSAKNRLWERWCCAIAPKPAPTDEPAPASVVSLRAHWSPPASPAISRCPVLLDLIS